MSILVCQTFANPTTELYGKGDVSKWSQYMALYDVNMNDKAIQNIHSLQAPIGNQLVIETPSNFDMSGSLDIDYNHSTGNGNMMNGGGLTTMKDPYFYVADNITAVPQIASTIVVRGLDTTIAYSDTGNIGSQTDEIHLVQSDTSQMYWKLNMSIRFDGTTANPLGIWLSFNIQNNDHSYQGQLYDYSNPFMVNPVNISAGVYRYTASWTDTIYIIDDFYTQYGDHTTINDWLDINVVNAFGGAHSSTNISNIRYTYTLEPVMNLNI
jgi:hypothetical protein